MPFVTCLALASMFCSYPVLFLVMVIVLQPTAFAKQNDTSFYWYVLLSHVGSVSPVMKTRWISHVWGIVQSECFWANWRGLVDVCLSFSYTCKWKCNFKLDPVFLFPSTKKGQKGRTCSFIQVLNLMIFFREAFSVKCISGAVLSGLAKDLPEIGLIPGPSMDSGRLCQSFRQWQGDQPGSVLT